jgi:hypothetical protein
MAPRPPSEVDSNLSDTAQRTLTEMFGIVDSVQVDDIQNEGITIRSGNKLLKLQVVSEEPITIEDEIREEFRQKLRTKMQEIKNRLNQKVTEIVESTSRIKAEAERKERDLKRKLAEAMPMPQVKMEHAKRGLSVVKGSRQDELVWLVQGVYWPKFVDDRPIEPRYSKKLISNVIYMVTTKGNKVTGVSTHKPIGLDFFDHYHQQNPDCWGHWSYPKSWRSADDIIAIARAAEAVLENVNTNSIAHSSPRGLPRKATLLRHRVANTRTERKRATDERLNLNQESVRTGVTGNTTGDVWSIDG